MMRAGLNKIARRRQIILLIALTTGISAGGIGTWMVSGLSFRKSTAQDMPGKEPAPDMTGVVNQTFDGRVERSALAEAQRLNKETQTEMAMLRKEMAVLGNDLKDAHEQIRELRNDNDLLQTQLEAGKEFGSPDAEPLPGALISPESAAEVSTATLPAPAGAWTKDVTRFDRELPSGIPVNRPGRMDSVTFVPPENRKKENRFPWIHSGSFAEAIVVEGADANASVTGDKNTVPMQLRLTGKVQMPNDRELDLTGCFVTLEAWGDVSSERALVRTRSISCQLGEDTIDQKIAGHVSFMGKNGIRGEAVMRNGQILLYAGGAGFLDGIGKGIEKASSTTVGIGATAGMSVSDIGQAGLGGGVSAAARTLSEYYIKRAEQYHPVIPIGAGNDVTLVFQDGFQLETLEESRQKADAHMKTAAVPAALPVSTPDMLRQLQDFSQQGPVNATAEQAATP